MNDSNNVAALASHVRTHLKCYSTVQVEYSMREARSNFRNWLLKKHSLVDVDLVAWTIFCVSFNVKDLTLARATKIMLSLVKLKELQSLKFDTWVGQISLSVIDGTDFVLSIYHPKNNVWK